MNYKMFIKAVCTVIAVFMIVKILRMPNVVHAGTIAALALYEAYSIKDRLSWYYYKQSMLC